MSSQQTSRLASGQQTCEIEIDGHGRTLAPEHAEATSGELYWRTDDAHFRVGAHQHKLDLAALTQPQLLPQWLGIVTCPLLVTDVISILGLLVVPTTNI